MEETLNEINSLVENKTIKKYAIGGAIASTFYIEPVSTFDLDIMIVLNEDAGNLDPLRDIFNWAKEKEFEIDNEYIIIKGIPVQFLIAYNELIVEAVENAQKQKYLNVETFVISPEYLVAIMLDTNRSKDRERAVRFISEYKLDNDLLNKILIKYNLKDRFNKLST